MAERLQVYRCNVCGNIVEVMHGSDGELVCCGKPMELLVESSTDAATEKHVPVIEEQDGGYLVKVGEVEHPMTEKHYIEWIEVITDDNRVYRKYLTPNDKPQAFFKVDGKVMAAREYCTLHGHWKNGG